MLYIWDSKWLGTCIDLAMVSIEIQWIHETPSKEQSPAQLKRLEELRALARTLGDRRYALLRRKPNVPNKSAICAIHKQSDLHGVTLELGDTEIGVVTVSSVQPSTGEEWKWKVLCGRKCLSYNPANLRQYDMSFEPMPSSRTDEWLQQYRFTAIEDALFVAKLHVEFLRENYIQAMAHLNLQLAARQLQ